MYKATLHDFFALILSTFDTIIETGRPICYNVVNLYHPACAARPFAEDFKIMLQRYFCTNKNFYRTVLAITLPIALQNVISLGVNVMDTVMLGQLGDLALSAANLGSQPFMILNSICFGLASGAAVLIAQYWGRRDMLRIRQLFAISLRCVLAAAAILSVAGLFFPEWCMSIFSNEAEVITAGAGYLRVLALSFVCFGFSSCYIMCLRGVEQVKISMVVYGTSFFVNVFFNYCFIFGKIGFPALGIPGAAWGTVIARVWECAVVLFYMCRIEKVVEFTPSWLFKGRSGLIGDYVKNSVPIVGNELLYGMGTAAANLIIGHMSSQFVAAASISNVVIQVISVFNWGVSNAAAVLVGKTIGEGRRHEVEKVANSLLAISFLLGLTSGILLLVCRSGIVSLYAISDEAGLLTYDLLTLLSFLQPFQTLVTTMLVGVLRGGGDVRTNFILDCGLQWIVGIPLAALAAFVWHWPPLLVFLMLRADYPFKLLIGGLRLHSGRWVRTVTRD